MVRLAPGTDHGGSLRRDKCLPVQNGVMAPRCLLLLLALCSAEAVQSPPATGTIQGTVVDSSGGAVAGARIRATHTGMGYVRTGESDAAGQFRLAGLPPGEYELRVEMEGFAAVLIPSMPLAVGQTVVQRIELKPAPVSERMEVKERPEALETAATTASAALGLERIEEAPAPNRNYLNFVLVAPGVTSSNGSNAQRSFAGLRSPAADSGFSFAGLRGRNNSLSIDGVDNRDETTGGNRVAIGLEMVQEFRVSSVSIGAELGGAAGGALNVVTRSGTNIWHGDATFFTQNEKLNARNPEVELDRRPRFRRWQPGASLMGPARRDRTFFATAWEQERESAEEWSGSPEELRTIPALSGLYRGLYPTRSRDTVFSFKTDHIAGTRHSLSLRYAFSRGDIRGEVLDGDTFADRSARGSSLTTDHSLAGGWIWVPGPSWVNDLRFQAARRSVSLTPNSYGVMIEVPGVIRFGQSCRLDADRREDHFELRESFTWTSGRRQLSTGASLHGVRLDARLADRFGGLFIFPTLQDLRAGRADVFLKAFGRPETHYWTVPVGLWVQDRWQVAPGLTLEAGLRYDRQWLPDGIPEAGRNLAPRFGLAWRPADRGPWVFRAGLGWFFDRYPLAFLNEAIQKNGVQAFEQYLVGEQAARAFASSGAWSAPLAWAPRSIYRVAEDFPSTYARKLAFGLERSLGPDTTLTLEYALVAGRHLPRIRNVRGELPPLYQLEQTARSSYRGASVALQRRLSRELAFLLAYHTGRTLDDASDYDEQPQNPLDPQADWALSRQHQRHRLAASALFQLPTEELRQLPTGLRKALADVIVAPILTAGRGRPINALLTTDALRTGAWPITARAFGLPRNPFYSPSTFSMDLRVMKGFWLKDRRAILQTGLEAFNLTNHTNPLRVSPYLAAGAQRLPTYNQPVETLNARQIQFMMQIEY